jgi:hypothetical protein
VKCEKKIEKQEQNKQWHNKSEHSLSPKWKGALFSV